MGYFKFYTDNRDYAPDQNIEIDLTRIAQRGADALNKGIVLKLKDEFEPGFSASGESILRRIRVQFPFYRWFIRILGRSSAISNKKIP